MSLAHVDTLISFAMVMLLLSLLIMALIEACNTLMMRRGRNLTWGVAQVLEQMGMDEADAQKLAQLVLRHPAIAPSGKVPASAIRIDELARILSDYVSKGDALRAKGLDPAKIPAALKSAAAGIEASLAEQLGAHRVEQLHGIADVAGEIARDKVAELGATVSAEALRSAIANEVRSRVEAAANGAIEQAAKLQAWFDMVMDRTTERFVSRTRSWTVAIAAVMCIAFQIDSVKILQRLSTDTDLRNSLVASSGAVLGEAEKSMIELDSAKTLATDALLDVRKELQASSEAKSVELAKLLPGDIAPLRTPFQAHEWLAQHVTDEPARDALAERFDAAFQKRLDEHLARVREVGTTIAARLDQTQLDVLTLHMPPWNGYADAEGRFQWRHVWGVLASILLLSLGAPFWFNTLSKLSNLRPIVARKVDAEEKAQLQATAAGDANTTAANK